MSRNSVKGVSGLITLAIFLPAAISVMTLQLTRARAAMGIGVLGLVMLLACGGAVADDLETEPKDWLAGVETDAERFELSQGYQHGSIS